MSIFQAIVLGIIQGLTEFLPISSSGHLVIFKYILGVNIDAGAVAESGALFEVILHVGTLLAIIVIYYKDVLMLIREGIGLIIDLIRFISGGFRKKRNRVRIVATRDRRMLLLILTASLPTALIGFLLKDIFEQYLMQSLLATGIALLITGGLLKLSQRLVSGHKRVEKATYKNAVAVGLLQGLAITPGISRSGSTIVGGLLCGFDKEFAIKFSFLMSLPAVGGAALLKATEVPLELIRLNAAAYLSGMAASAIVGFICIKTLLVLLRRNKFHYFSYYCFLVGALAIGWSIFFA